MKASISLFFMVICTVVFAAQQSQAKKGCNAYGYACYGGHGKRSLSNGIDNVNEQNDLHQDGILLPNEASMLTDNDVDIYPKYRLWKLMKSLLGEHQRRPQIPMERLNDFDYPIAGGVGPSYNHENKNF